MTKKVSFDRAKGLNCRKRCWESGIRFEAAVEVAEVAEVFVHGGFHTLTLDLAGDLDLLGMTCGHARILFLTPGA